MYTEKLVAEMRKIGQFSYEDAVKFAEEHNLSTRSVVSKVKHLGLPYTPKQKAAPKTNGVKKADLVRGIKTKLGAEGDCLDSLVNAKMADLQVLFLNL